MTVPVGFGGPSALGGVQPVTNAEVRLVSEDLVLTLGDDGTKRAGLDGTSALRARASSELAPQGKFSYSAGHAVDGDAATAWCEGKPGPGIGEWIEVRHVGISTIFPSRGAER